MSQAHSLPIQRFDEIIQEIRPVIAGMDPEVFSHAVAMLHTAPRIFLAGAGRSGLLMKMFAMRLMQAGCNAAVAGESTTPSIQRRDLLVVSSGSGNTATMRVLAETGVRMDASILLLTYSPDSILARSASHVLSLPVPRVETRLRRERGDGFCDGSMVGCGTTPCGGVSESVYGFGEREGERGIRSQQILGTLFDQAVQFTCTLLVEAVALRRGETNLSMQARHANLE